MSSTSISSRPCSSINTVHETKFVIIYVPIIVPVQQPTSNGGINIDDVLKMNASVLKSPLVKNQIINALNQADGTPSSGPNKYGFELYSDREEPKGCNASLEVDSSVDGAEGINLSNDSGPTAESTKLCVKRGFMESSTPSSLETQYCSYPSYTARSLVQQQRVLQPPLQQLSVLSSSSSSHDTKYYFDSASDLPQPCVPGGSACSSRRPPISGFPVPGLIGIIEFGTPIIAQFSLGAFASALRVASSTAPLVPCSTTISAPCSLAKCAPLKYPNLALGTGSAAKDSLGACTEILRQRWAMEAWREDLTMALFLFRNSVRLCLMRISGILPTEFANLVPKRFTPKQLRRQLRSLLKYVTSEEDGALFQSSDSDSLDNRCLAGSSVARSDGAVSSEDSQSKQEHQNLDHDDVPISSLVSAISYESLQRSYVFAPSFVLSGPTNASFRMHAWIEDRLDIHNGILFNVLESTKFNKDNFANHLSDAGLKMWNEPNAGGSSAASEVLSFEILKNCFGARLVATEMEIQYNWGSKITDYSCEIYGRKFGVSVTRMIDFHDIDKGKFKPPLTRGDISKLMKKKLGGILASTNGVFEEFKWEKQILHVFATSHKVREAFEMEWNTMSSDLR
eukprot:CAMPEP_0168549278 /NCGR_PEP_ID=MMETSP0413-20121227/5016_1 /TAXON_ID=136452 /ORGANISM="Filamoeba nolandi, Strain NC-AS-23-1" /LENGTH=623 /DNA_ID=CAMNT_0008579651 /DNA_START=56 /DNA_END=1924 /DNA_ORIENTATION=+